jgi:uncharacterized membrane protein YgcG
MDVMTLAIAFVAIAGPSILALVLDWRNNPDRRLSRRRAAENTADTDPAHFRRPSVQWLFSMGGGDGGGGGGGSDSGGGSGGDGGGGSS